MSNAVKFTANGSVMVTATTSTTNLQVEVADTGIGIKSEHLGMLFEAFRQVDGSAKRVYEGTGLGLYLCRKLLSYDGRGHSVQSEYGKGSRFMFSLPLDLAIRYVMKVRSMERRKALLVEDNENNRYLLKLLLEERTSQL